MGTDPLSGTVSTGQQSLNSGGSQSASAGKAPKESAIRYFYYDLIDHQLSCSPELCC